ncbi:hypothetical protein P170DRAFT_465641 [Aspergillus steynii IBT 23096]|uniref:DUF7587 domain-containing protein n=1 Tax=Aspergillus steynii IBT 23096 TaxID=1392250 RepID=A0A2I2G5R1_9EURO|nr:uncharacterized protein P170DRAFT_465641 [Aspergillus steynii IBT 23096]PLB48215.1 hypothetical protein P170DRAFT_465641 [Aspergillus steynii IBT 23096]
MKRDKYGLRTHFPSSKYVGFADESSEEYLGKRATNFGNQARLNILKKETSKLRDTLRVFNSFRFNIPRIQGEILNAIPQLVAGPENAELSTHGQSEHDIEIQRLTAESRIIQNLITLLQEFNAGLSNIQGTLNKFLIDQGTSRPPIDVYPQIRLDSPASVSINYEKIGFLSPAMGNFSYTEKELTKEDVEHHLRDGDRSFPPTISVSTIPARIYNISKRPTFCDKGECYVYIIDPGLLQLLGITCRATSDLVEELGIEKYSLRNQDGAQYVTPSHHICHGFIPVEAIIMKMKLDVYYLLLEKTGITIAGSLLDTTCIQKLTVQDYLGFARKHNMACSETSRVELGPAANGFLSLQEHVADIGVESLVTKMSAFQLPV